MFLILCLVSFFSSLILNCTCETNNYGDSKKVDASLRDIKVIATANIVSNDTMETQHTICRISSDQLIADAEATVTKVLTGACNAKVIDERFRSLEFALNEQFSELKSLLIRVIQKNIDIEENKSLRDENDKMNDINKSIDNKKYPSSPRQHEIEKFNNTISIFPSTEESFKVFIYYWKIDDIKEKLLKWKTASSLRSSTFYIEEARYAMYMKFTPKYFPDGTIFVSIGLTRGSHDNYLKWPFSLKLQVEILDHSPEYLRKDRRSRLWDPSTVCSAHFWGQPSSIENFDNPECVGLSIPRTAFFNNNKYTWHDNAFIKLTVYL